MCTALCSPVQGANYATGWGLVGSYLVMARVSFSIDGDRVSWSFGQAHYYRFDFSSGKPLTYSYDAAAVVTKITAC